MANREATPARLDWKAVLTRDADGFRALLQTVVQEVLEAEMTEALQAEKGERTASRLGHRSGYYNRKLVTQATAKLNDIDPEAWLADVLRRINDHPASGLDELLPWNWTARNDLGTRTAVRAA